MRSSHPSDPGRGVHYTPPEVARYMAEISLDTLLSEAPPPDRPAAAPWVLDPACGAGALLSAVRERLRRRGLPGTLCGVDRDPAGLAEAQRRCPRALLRRGHALIEPAALGWAEAIADAWDPRAPTGFPEAMAGGGFDLIIGNPPFVFGEHLDPAERGVYQRTYLAGQDSQPDLYKLFYERTVRDLLRAGGVHTFIVPDALLARDESRAFRRWLSAHLEILRVCHVGPVFGSRRGISAVILCGRARRPGPHSQQIQVDPWPRDGSSVPRAATLPSDGAPWCLHAPPAWGAVAGALGRSSRRLGDVLLRGAAGASRGEELGAAALGPDGLPTYVGRDVARHRARPPARCLTRPPRKRAQIYRGPKVLLVKTGAGPVAACVTDDHPALQSVYLLHPSREAPGPHALAAVICSALLTAWCYYTWTGQKRLQPQLTLGNVRALPLPPPHAAWGRLELDARTLNERLGAGAAEGAELEALERTLDEQIAALFGLELARCLPALRPALDALPRSQRPRWWR